jgi:predicted nucleic acid-binding protein
VNRRSAKFVLDTHLFIDAFRDRAAEDALLKFHYGFAPFEYLSGIVAQELRAGTRGADDRNALERNVLKLFARTNRIITPSADAWHRSGDVLAAMAAKEGRQLARVSKAFGNDILLAISCRESGCILITENERDFARISRFVDFKYMKPWTRHIGQSS